MLPPQLRHLSTSNVLLQTQNPSEKLHSGKYVAAYVVPLREHLEQSLKELGREFCMIFEVNIQES